jgi:KUP system potassium uptake protein
MISTPDTAPGMPDSASSAVGSSSVKRHGPVVLAFGALGVVFGDIGTSPLYSMKQAFSQEHGLAPDPGTVYGVLSLVFWTITLIVTVKYVTFVMRADNGGEGGTMALIALVQRVKIRARRTKWALIALGVLGAALFCGDGMITPAVSVLSAVEGLEVAEPSLDAWIVPIAFVLLGTLFIVQRLGTSMVGKAFGPVMLIWFAAIGLLGLVQVIREPAILGALSPTYAVAFFLDHGVTAFLALGAVVLVITGSEALYADIGHFGPTPIRRAWFAVVLPALVLNYLGQGALLLSDRSAVDNPFFRLVPTWAQIPMLLLATAATVIASQSVITGTFSVARQAVQLGYLPFLTIRHTSDREQGQIYVPAVNWFLVVAVLGLVVGFGSSTALASAYEIAVTGTLTITTVLFFVIVRTQWHGPLWLMVAGLAFFLLIELAFFSANLTKVLSGGWFPLVVGVVLSIVLMTWHRGREIVSRNRSEREGSLKEFVLAIDASDDRPVRVPGTAVYLNANVEMTPLALRRNVAHNHVLHEHAVILNVETVGVPHVTGPERMEIDDLLISDDGISRVTVRFGFQDDPDVLDALRLARESGLDIDLDHASYFLSRIAVTATTEPGMARWRKHLYRSIGRNAASPASYFGLPADRVVSLGSGIDL